jgi:hypothetical protein
MPLSFCMLFAPWGYHATLFCVISPWCQYHTTVISTADAGGISSDVEYCIWRKILHTTFPLLGVIQFERPTIETADTAADTD